jgi:hypothetical protein
MKKIKEKAEGSVNHHGLRFLKKEKNFSDRYPRAKQKLEVM